MPTAKLTSKGQITIPRDVRERLGLEAGDRVVFEFDPRGSVVFRLATDERLGRIRGFLERLGRDRRVTVEEMNQAVRARARQRGAK